MTKDELEKSTEERISNLEEDVKVLRDETLRLSATLMAVSSRQAKLVEIITAMWGNHDKQ